MPQFEIAGDKVGSATGDAVQVRVGLCCFAVQLYTREGWAIPPDVLGPLLAQRSLRAHSRSHGLRVLSAVADECRCVVVCLCYAVL